MPPNVLAFHHIAVIPIQLGVAQNVSTAVTVQLSLLVLISIVEILVQEFVAQMLIVPLQITFPFVLATVDSTEILLLDVEKINQSIFLQSPKILANLLHVVPIHCAVLLMEDLLVLV